MRIRATLTTLASVTLGSAMLLAAAPVRFDDGYLVTMKISSDQEPTTATFKVSGEKVRLEMNMSSVMGGGRGGGGGTAAMAEGAYLLPQPGGKLAMIAPNSPMGPIGLLIDGAVLGGGGGGRGRGGMGGAPPAEMTDVSVTVDDMGSGESMLGHSTHKYKLHRKFTQNGTAHDDTEEFWMTTDFPGAEKGFATVGSLFGKNAGELGVAVMAKMPKGVPLKIISTSVGGNGTAATTIEVTEIKKSTFEAAEFEVPPGVQLMDLNAMMGGRRGGGMTERK